jgi:hypothetical protein
MRGALYPLLHNLPCRELRVFHLLPCKLKTPGRKKHNRRWVVMKGERGGGVSYRAGLCYIRLYYGILEAPASNPGRPTKTILMRLLLKHSEVLTMAFARMLARAHTKKCITLIVFVRRNWLCERASMLRYTYIAWLVYSLSNCTVCACLWLGHVCMVQGKYLNFFNISCG